ncbi:hypothetical protein HY624_00570 [Candidatus Uhrbacteria bacterium]|nr:hypothetical protein [Candidatus Uhrbacteria bacterium]
MTHRRIAIYLLTFIVSLNLFVFVQPAAAATYFKLIPTPTGSCPQNPASSDQKTPYPCCTRDILGQGECTEAALGNCAGSGQIRGGSDLPCNYSLCDFLQLFVNGMNIIVTIAAGIALIILIWGAQGLLLSGGSEEKVTEAKTLMKNAAIGLLIILVSWQLIAILIGLFVPNFGAVQEQTGFQWNLLGNVRDLCR